MNLSPKRVWRVNPDGEVRDTFYTLENVFQMSEEMFFRYYLDASDSFKVLSQSHYAKELQQETARLRSQIPELPFSNAWIAQNTVNKLPKNCEVHFGILNSLRTWNAFHIDDSIDCFCNTGGFGIDGCLSSAIGASFVNTDKICFCILGDLAFFYDMNSVGNRHISSNLRVIMVNNGCGAEFHIPACVTKRAGMDEVFINRFTAASGHYGVKSLSLIKNFTEDLGFEYVAIHDKDHYLEYVDKITSEEKRNKPLFVEVFTEAKDDASALKEMTTILTSTKGAIKELAKSILGAKNIQKIKNSFDL